jgi:hypothetical protein
MNGLFMDYLFANIGSSYLATIHKGSVGDVGSNGFGI